MPDQEVIEGEVTQTQALTVYEGGRGSLALLSEDEFAARVKALKLERKRIQQVQRDVMVEGVDYGTIPGAGDRKVLFKPGQEAMCDMYSYRLQTIADRTEGDNEASPAISWTVHTLVHLGSMDGPVVGDGWGSCNSWERKYRYRRGGRTCPECGKEGTIIDDTDFNTKQVKGWLCWKKKDGCGTKFPREDSRITSQAAGEIENVDPWDLDNTLLKMAAKRSRVDATLSVCAASGLFTQDVGDVDDDDNHAGEAAVPAAEAKPKGKPKPAAAASPPAPAQTSAQEEKPADQAQNGSAGQSKPYLECLIMELDAAGKAWFADELRKIGCNGLAEVTTLLGHAVTGKDSVEGTLADLQAAWDKAHKPAGDGPVNQQQMDAEAEIDWPDIEALQPA